MPKTPAKKEAAAVAAWGDYEGPSGFDDSVRDMVTIPFVILLQSNSPIVEDGDGTAGEFYNTALETTQAEFRFIPVDAQKIFLEKTPYDDGGDLVARHAPDSEIVRNAIRDNGGSTVRLTVGDNELVESVYLYALVEDAEGVWQQCIIPFASTKLKRFRLFNNRLNALQVTLPNGRRMTLPPFATICRATSDQEVAKKNGKKYQNIVLGFAGETAEDCRLTPEDELFQAALGFREQVRGGKVVAASSENETATEGGDEEIPF